jgi:hypothetical protein
VTRAYVQLRTDVEWQILAVGSQIGEIRGRRVEAECRLLGTRDIPAHVPSIRGGRGFFEAHPVTIAFPVARLEQAGRAVHFPNAFVIVGCRDCGVGLISQAQAVWIGGLGKDSTNTSAG